MWTGFDCPGLRKRQCYFYQECKQIFKTHFFTQVKIYIICMVHRYHTIFVCLTSINSQVIPSYSQNFIFFSYFPVSIKTFNHSDVIFFLIWEISKSFLSVFTSLNLDLVLMKQWKIFMLADPRNLVYLIHASLKVLHQWENTANLKSLFLATVYQLTVLW